MILVGLGGFAAAVEKPLRQTLFSQTTEEEMGVDDDFILQWEDEQMEPRVGVQSPPPASTQLARTLGMPSQRVQIMKASFFDTDNDYTADVSMG